MNGAKSEEQRAEKGELLPDVHKTGAVYDMAGDAKLFRFEELQVWQRAADLMTPLGDIADRLEQQRRYRFAEQLRGASLSISNNIAEGSGSDSKNEFRNFLNFARRSAFECASMLMAFRRQKLIEENGTRELIVELDEVCRMITSLSRSLK